MLRITDKVCIDTMSGMPSLRSVSVALETDMFAWCGGEPGTLLQGDWVITEIDDSHGIEADDKVRARR